MFFWSAIAVKFSTDSITSWFKLTCVQLRINFPDSIFAIIKRSLIMDSNSCAVDWIASTDCLARSWSSPRRNRTSAYSRMVVKGLRKSCTIILDKSSRSCNISFKAASACLRSWISCWSCSFCHSNWRFIFSKFNWFSTRANTSAAWKGLVM